MRFFGRKLGKKGNSAPPSSHVQATSTSGTEVGGSPTYENVAVYQQRKKTRTKIADRLKQFTFTKRKGAEYLAPGYCDPQEFYSGYLFICEKFKSDGNYKVRRHLRLHPESGLRIFQSELETDAHSLSSIDLDYIRVELIPEWQDSTSPPRFHFTLKNEDLTGKSWFLAAPSNEERRKWMVYIAHHVSIKKQPPLGKLNKETREYLGPNRPYDSSSEFDSKEEEEQALSSDEEEREESSEREIYMANEPVVPVVAISTDAADEGEIYCEFGIGQEKTDDHMVPSNLEVDSRRGSLGVRKESTTRNIFPVESLSVAPLEIEQEDTYAVASHISANAAPRSLYISVIGEEQYYSERDDDENGDDGIYHDPTSMYVREDMVPVSAALAISTPEDDIYNDLSVDQSPTVSATMLGPSSSEPAPLLTTPPPPSLVSSHNWASATSGPARPPRSPVLRQERPVELPPHLPPNFQPPPDQQISDEEDNIYADMWLNG